MSKKIVVITGSPRKNGNSNAMADSFISAAKEKGNTVTKFDATKMNRRLSCLRNMLYNRKAMHFQR